MTEDKPKSNIKIIVIGIAAIVVVVAAVLMITGKSKDGGDDSNGGASVVVDSRVTADELKANPDITVQYGDYDTMATLAKDIQNGYATGKIVSIEGDVSHPMSSYSIVEKSEDGSKKIGTVFLIDDAKDDAYPNDGSRIRITAKVVEVNTLNYQLVTLKSFVSTEK